LSLKRAVFQIFDTNIRLQKYRDLEIRIRGHSRSSKLVPFNTWVMVSYQCSIET